MVPSKSYETSPNSFRSAPRHGGRSDIRCVPPGRRGPHPPASLSGPETGPHPFAVSCPDRAATGHFRRGRRKFLRPGDCNDPGRAGARGNPTMNASPSPRIGFHRCATVPSARPSLPEGWALKIPVDGMAGPVVQQGRAYGCFTRLEPSVFTGGAKAPVPVTITSGRDCSFYRGFAFLLLPDEDQFAAGLLNQGQPIQVRWNGRTTWTPANARATQAKQFLRGWLGGWLR